MSKFPTDVLSVIVKALEPKCFTKFRATSKEYKRHVSDRFQYYQLQAFQELKELSYILIADKCEKTKIIQSQEKRLEDFKFIIKRDNLLKMLPIVDNFSLALKNTANAEEFMKGMDLIYAQFNTFLEDNGVSIVLYDAYKPDLHEALMKVDDESDENTILEVFQDGYMLDGRVLRPAKVKVSGGKK